MQMLLKQSWTEGWIREEREDGSQVLVPMFSGRVRVFLWTMVTELDLHWWIFFPWRCHVSVLGYITPRSLIKSQPPSRDVHLFLSCLPLFVFGLCLSCGVHSNVLKMFLKNNPPNVRFILLVHSVTASWWLQSLEKRWRGPHPASNFNLGLGFTLSWHQI